MGTIREDLMDAIGRYRKRNEENSMTQSKATTEGTIQALKYQFKADAADDYAFICDAVLKAHGL